MKKIKSRLFICIGSFIIFLILLELGLRFGGYLYLNMLLTKAKIEENDQLPFTILCIGDSYTVGGGGKWKDSYPRQLKKILSDNYKKEINVINGGICEANSTQALQYLSKLIGAYKIDSVILLIGSANRFNLVGFYSNNFINIITGLRVYKLAKIFLINVKGEVLKRYTEKNMREENKRRYDYNDLLEICGNADIYYKSIEERYKNEISLNPTETKTYFQLGQCYKEQKKFKEAEMLYDEVLKNDPGNVNAYIELGVCYRLQGKVKEAEKLYRRLIANDINTTWIYSELGFCCLKQNKYKEAEKYFRRALDLDPYEFYIYVDLAFCYFSQGRYREAEANYKKALQLSPNNEDIYNDLEKLYIRQGNYAEAINASLKAIEIDPTCFDNYYFLLKAYKFQSMIDSNFILQHFYKIGEKNPQLKKNKIFQNYISLFNDKKKMEDKINKWLRCDLEKITLLCKKNNINLIVQNYPYPYHSANHLLKEVATKYALPFVDNYTVFDNLTAKNKRKKYFVDHDHCTAEGHSVMAENIYKLFIELEKKGISI